MCKENGAKSFKVGEGQRIRSQKKPNKKKKGEVN